MIDEHEWRSVLQVAKDGTFSAAAKHLYISQPSLSQCIKKVRRSSACVCSTGARRRSR